MIFFSKKPLKDGVFFSDGNIIVNIGKKHAVMKPKINIVGMHNIENILAASAASYAAGVKLSVVEEVVSKYKGVEHRIEFVKTLNGVDYYNDSKSTNVDSTRVALESFDKNILIIMGGRDKGIPYTSLKELVRRRVKSIFLIGEAADKIKKDLKNAPFIDCGDMENAIKRIFKTAVRGDIVLLSPACASFDQFENFEERGKVFKKMVLSLKSSV